MIKITNKKVVEFYQANPNISVDHVNLLLIDMMEKMVHDSMNTSMVSQLLERLNTIESDVKKTQESVTKTRYASADTMIYCENCKYSFKTKQGMSAHKRHCNKT